MRRQLLLGGAIAAAAVVGLAVPVTAAGPSAPSAPVHAAAAGPAAGRAITYACTLARQGLEPLLRVPGKVELRSAVAPPATVAPGDALDLDGSFAVALPEALRQVLAIESAQVTARAASIGLTATAIRGTTSTVTPLKASWTSDRVTTTTKPLVLTGDLDLPDYYVPENADAVRVGLPSANDVAPLVSNKPAAFNLEVAGTGRLGVAVAYVLSCVAPQDVPALAGLAVAPATAPPAPAPTPVPTPAPPAPGAVEVPPLASGPVVLAPPAQAPAVQPPVMPVADAVAVSDWALTPDLADDGSGIPRGTLLLVTLAVVVACAISTVVSAYRVRLLRRALGQR